MRKTYLIPLIVTALIASLFACDKKDGKKQLSLHPTYSWVDSLILREGIDAGDTLRAYFLIDSLEKTGDLNELGAETFRLITHQRFYHHNEIDAEVERMGRQIVTHNSLEDRKQWYYNYGASWLAYQLYMTHNYEGFLRVAVPLIASMDSLGNGHYDQMTNVLTMMACCYVKLNEPTVELTTNQRAAVRALSLLLDNARKFTAPAEAYGHQTLSDEKQRVVLKLSVVDGGVQFIVEDTGIGVPTDEAEHIFDEFVQLNEYYDGTGIGLTVARSLARRLGGDVQLDTTYTDGARFVMSLPSVG